MIDAIRSSSIVDRPNDPAESAAPADQSLISAAADPIPSGDPWVAFGALHGLHQGVPQFAYPSNGRDHADSSWKGNVPQFDAKKDVRGASKTAPIASCQAPPAKAYDVANTTQAEIDALKNSKCGTREEQDQQHRLGHTIENAKASYGDLLAQHPPVKIVVTTSAGNGGQPVMIVTGPRFDPNQNAHVHTHYHGDNATVADPLGSKAGTNARIRAVITNEDTQVVFVLPEASNSTWKVDSPQNDNSYSASWNHVKSQVQTTDDALNAAGVTKVDQRVVSFHSGGGMALVNLMRADPKGSLLKADRIELYDCVYHFKNGTDKFGKPNPPLIAENYIRARGNTANGKAVAQVIFYRGGNDVARAQVIEKGFQPKAGKATFRMIDMNNEKKLDNTINPIARDTNGNTFPQTVVSVDKKGHKIVTQEPAHNFNPDPHYRTVGQFLGSKPRP